MICPCYGDIDLNQKWSDLHRAGIEWLYYKIVLDITKHTMRFTEDRAGAFNKQRASVLAKPPLKLWHG